MSLALGLIGCGGSGGGHQLAVPAEISGLVLDQGGNIVRDATVFIDGSHTTRSNSRGEFVLQNVPFERVLLKAQDDQDGSNFYGEQVVELFSGERTKSANIMVVLTSKLARVQGTVHANTGELLSGARVFFNAGTRTSTYAISDHNGNYHLDALVGGLTYTVTVTGAGFNSSTDTITPVAGQTRELDVVLTTPTDPALAPPTGLAAIAWSTPDASIAFNAMSQNAYEQVKRLIMPKRAAGTHQARLTNGGNPIEVDLTWTAVTDPGLLGYGVYRRVSGPATPDAIDFDKDPLATLYEDNDASLVQNASYDYALTSINTSDLSGSSHGESPLSGFVTASTLGDLPVDPVTTGPVTFHWHAGSGATSYTVFVFDRFPSLGIDPIWTSAPTGGTSTIYGGPALTSGHDYFFIVSGSANSNTSFTLSPVLSFTAP